MSTKLSSDKLTTCEMQRKPNLQSWLVDELTILAEALGEVVTTVRFRIYAQDLCTDLTREQLQTALTRARRELKFFPKISELRELAGVSSKDQQQVEAEAAWQFANQYLHRWGVDLMPEYLGAGKWRNAPALPDRVDYALRRIGGLRGLNQITEESRPFKFRDFVEAYQQAPLAEQMLPQLTELFAVQKLLSTSEPEEAARAGPGVQSTGRTALSAEPVLKLKRIPEPLTDAQLRDRRAVLKQQVDMIRDKVKIEEGGTR